MSRVLRRSSFRTWYWAGRARLSIPALLASVDERKVVSAVAGIHGGLAILVIGLFAWLTNLPLVFPALGPTAFVLFSDPFSRAAAPRSVVVGHLVGIATGRAAWHFVSYVSGEAVSLDAGGWPVFCSASLALAITSLLLVRLSCPHAPACASALIVGFGGVTQWSGLLAMAAAVILLASQAVCLNRLAGVRVPAWSSRPQSPLPEPSDASHDRDR